PAGKNRPAHSGCFLAGTRFVAPLGRCTCIDLRATPAGSPRESCNADDAAREGHALMYRYDEFDARLVRERAEQFRYQVNRRLAGELTEDEFKPLRLQNGLYLQLHSYMLRIAIPYGTLSSVQLRKLGSIARRYDKGYGHFTTRTNLQLHWVRLV